jgi:hypothetical protein
MTIRLALAALLVAAAVPARAHHGVASASFAGAEGPGAALETTSALPLPARTLFVLGKTEYARFRRFDFAAPENKDHSSFTTLGVGYGLLPWLSAYLFQPYAVKAQDAVGTSRGAGDPSLLVAVAFKWDEGLRLVPERESLDELADWHFSAWASSTFPAGPVGGRDDRGDYFAPDMQSGFGAPSPAAGLAVTKQVSRAVTLLGEASHQRFLTHRYAFTRYRFGAETRANAAVVWRASAAGPFRLDAIAELNGLHLGRDQEDLGGGLEPLEASGGSILYAGAGLRAGYGSLGLALGAKRAALRSLNEGGDQQGSEGLESFRATATVTWTVGL